MDFICEIEKTLNKKAKLSMLPMQEGDIESTWADVSCLVENVGYKPDTQNVEGNKRFVDWYYGYFK